MVLPMTAFVISLVIFLLLTYVIFFNPLQKWFGQLDTVGMICVVFWFLAGLIAVLTGIYNFGFWIIWKLWLTQ